MKMNVIDWIACVLVVVGALNWGLMGLFNFNLVATLLGEIAALIRIIYVLIGLSGLWVIYAGAKCCKACRSS